MGHEEVGGLLERPGIGYQAGAAGHDRFLYRFSSHAAAKNTTMRMKQNTTPEATF
jgi:hypothetical protein